LSLSHLIRPTDLNPPRHPEQVNRKQNNLRLDRVLVSGKWCHQIIRNGIDQQETCQKQTTCNAVTKSQPESCKAECRRNQKSDMPGDHQIVSRYDVELRRRNP